jgi:hypothetical protein
MSEYQRYEFMTVDRPLTPQQLDAVNDLSSHIEASSTHAIIEYNWGDFKHDPIKVLYKFFDGFLYWANWGTPRFALRFPHGALPGDLIENYDFDEFVTFTQHRDYDILDIHFGEWEALDRWVDYELGSMIGVREELMDGDLRPLYLAWLACQSTIASYDYGEEDDYIEDEEDEEEGEDNELRGVMPVPPGMGELTAAQQSLAELLRLPKELLLAVAQYSSPAKPSVNDDFGTWVELLPQERRKYYLVRLARNEPGLSRLLITELRKLGRGETNAAPPEGKRVTYATLVVESKGIREKRERERREQERQARLRHLQDLHDHLDTFWRQVEKEASRGTASGYDEAVRLLVDLRDVANQFNETQDFQTRFHTWVRSYTRRPAFLKRLHERQFPLPQT